MWRWIGSIGLLGLLATLDVAPSARAEITADQVKVSIERGVKYLLSKQSPNGSWPDIALYRSGTSSLCTLALLNAGMPLDDPKLASALAHVRRQKLTQTYTVALQTMVLCAAEPEKDALLIKSNAAWLEAHQNKEGDKKGSWGYSPSQGARGPIGSGDNSNTQFAMLALYEAARIGVPVSDQTWRLARDYWLSVQNPDGSWGYLPGADGTGSMTCAGIGSMVMALDRLNSGDADVVGDQIECCGQQPDEERIEAALRWLGTNFTVHANPGVRAWLLYYLYGVERVGRLTNRRLIGGHDWFREGAEFLVNMQLDPGGNWQGSGEFEAHSEVSTSFALLFLAKGRRAVLWAKLKHEPDDDWNQHRGDLSNLTAYVEQRWKRDLTWQVIDIAQASVDDLLQSPVLVISGKASPRFSAAQVKTLREYIDRGGFILGESCCGDARFEAGFRRLVEQLFPEPDYQLGLLPPEHPVWSAEEPINPRYLPPLYGVEYGCRTSVMFSPAPLGCYWELARVGRELKYSPQVIGQITAGRSLGVNILAYATNRDVKFKLEIPLEADPDKKRDPLDRGRLFIAQLKHGGGWNVAPGALPNLLRFVKQQTGLRVATERREAALSGDELLQYHLVFMQGRNAFQLTAAERQRCQTFVERGGMIVADAVCASEAFRESFRREMAAIFPQQKLQRVSVDHPLFSTQFGGFDLRTVKLRVPDARAGGGPLKANVREVPPELEGILIGDRYGVLLSPYDLSCALEKHDSLGCTGYIREDAARLGLNIVLYSLH